MGLIKRAGRLLRLASGVLARACCCDDEGCCIIGGVVAAQYTSKAECEKCDPVLECGKHIGPISGSIDLPAGYTVQDGDFGNGYGTYLVRTYQVATCDECDYEYVASGYTTYDYASMANVTFPVSRTCGPSPTLRDGPCGVWQEPCPVPVCVYARYQHPAWGLADTEFLPPAASPCGDIGIVGTQVVQKPAVFAGRGVQVWVVGDFDDDIAIDGVPVSAAGRGAGPVATTFQLTAMQDGFALGAVNNIFPLCQGAVRICFTPVNPLP